MAEFTSQADMFNLTFMDKSYELSSVQVWLPVITAANFDDVIDHTTGLLSIEAGIRLVSLCNPYSRSFMVGHTFHNMGTPASNWAQREIGLQVGWYDTVTGKKGHMTIPGADRNTLAGDGDNVNYNHASWTALKLALETYAVSADGNPISINYGHFIGRRS